jgi:hypothetical protein
MIDRSVEQPRHGLQADVWVRRNHHRGRRPLNGICRAVVVDEAEGTNGREVAMGQRPTNVDRPLPSQRYLAGQQGGRLHNSIKTHYWCGPQMATPDERLVNHFDH